MVTFFAGNDEQTFQAKIREVVPDAEVVQVPLLEKWAFTVPVSGWASMFITRSCKNPEAAIKMLYWAKQRDNSLALTYGASAVGMTDGDVQALPGPGLFWGTLAVLLLLLALSWLLSVRFYQKREL